MTDQLNPYKPPQSPSGVEVLAEYYFDPKTEKIVVTGPTQAQQSAVDLEPVRRLIGAAMVVDFRSTPERDRNRESVQARWAQCCRAAEDALPTLQSLLAENERLREENQRITKAHVEAESELAALKVEITKVLGNMSMGRKEAGDAQTE